MADFERRDLEIGLEFGRLSFAKHNNFSEGSSEPKKYAQVIRVRGRQPHEFFNSNYLFSVAFELIWTVCTLYVTSSV